MIAVILFFGLLALVMVFATVALIAEWRANRRFVDDAVRRIARARREIDALPASGKACREDHAVIAALERTVEPCGICTSPLVDHEGDDQYCPWADRAINGDTRYCAKSTWEVTLIADGLEREQRALERQRDALLAACKEIGDFAESGVSVGDRTIEHMARAAIAAAKGGGA